MSPLTGQSWKPRLSQLTGYGTNQWAGETQTLSAHLESGTQ